MFITKAPAIAPSLNVSIDVTQRWRFLSFFFHGGMELHDQTHHAIVLCCLNAERNEILHMFTPLHCETHVHPKLWNLSWSSYELVYMIEQMFLTQSDGNIVMLMLVAYITS